MQLNAVRDYSGAKYPSLADHLARRRRGKVLRAVSLAAALAALAVLLQGCTVSG